MDRVLSGFSSEKKNKKGKSKQNLTEAMPIVVVGNANPLWEQMPSPPKTRPRYATWTWVKSEKQDDLEQK